MNISRTTVKYLALLAVAIVTFHWKTLLTDQFTTIVGYESVNQTYAWLHFWLRSVWTGHVPLWDPYVFGGRPFTEEMAAFYPLHLLFALVPLNRNELISPHFFHEYLAFNRFLGACFMFALMREFRRSHFAAFVAACAFSMGGVLGRLPWPQYEESCIWLPAIFLFLLRALRSEQRGRALVEAGLAGLCMGMSVLAGGVQFAMIQGICIVAAVAYFGSANHGSTNHGPTNHGPTNHGSTARNKWPRLAAILGVLVLAAFGAGAVQLLPSLEFGHLSIRSISGGWFPTTEKIPWDRLVKGMWPESIMTGLIPVGAQAGGEEPWPYYIGVLPLFFAATAIWKCWSNYWIRFFAILAVIVFAYTLGEFSPLFGVLYAIVPYLWMARGASRFVYLISFALAALSAFGLDTLLENAGNREAWEPARPFLKWVAIAAAAAIAVPGIFTQLTISIWMCLSLVLILCSCAWFFRLTLRSVPASVRVMLAAFILFDLGSFNWLSNNKNEMAKDGDNYVQMVTLREAAGFVNGRPGLHRTVVSFPSTPNIGDIYGVPELWGGGATMLVDSSHLSTHEDLFNVRYHIKPASTPDPGAIYQDKLWKVYEDKTGYPRAWVVHQTDIAPSHDEAFLHLDKPGLDLHNTAIIETPLPHPLESVSTGDSVRFKAYDPDSMSLDVNAGGNGLLVLSEVYYPGWEATVNDKAAVIHKVDGGLRGIEMQRGANHVELHYAPTSAYVGGALSLLTMAGLLLAGIFVRRKSAI